MAHCGAHWPAGPGGTPPGNGVEAGGGVDVGTGVEVWIGGGPAGVGVFTGVAVATGVVVGRGVVVAVAAGVAPGRAVAVGVGVALGVGVAPPTCNASSCAMNVAPSETVRRMLYAPDSCGARQVTEAAAVSVLQHLAAPSTVPFVACQHGARYGP
ncbi:MAG: hypothetical protein DWI58_01090 [Chloroflexi bacterium]|nr:MAG: hypothetical protein DWI58_01090 [Chloroflexota bacterium]